MAAAKSKKYVAKATPTKIVATSRAAIKIKDNYYTIEYSEERSLPTDVEYDLESEKTILWDEVDKTVDDEIRAIFDAYRTK